MARCAVARPPHARVGSDAMERPRPRVRRRRGRSLGPDLLAPETETSAIVARIRRADQSRLVGEALVDQRVVAGIGNMWLAEPLWQARVSPWSRLGKVWTRSSAPRSTGRGTRCGIGPVDARARRLPPGGSRLSALRRRFVQAASATRTAPRTGARPVSLKRDGGRGRRRRAHAGADPSRGSGSVRATRRNRPLPVRRRLSGDVVRPGQHLRLNELGQLRTIARISSVSAGSITAGVLGQAWRGARLLDRAGRPKPRRARVRPDSEAGRPNDRQPGDHLGPAAAGSHDRADACELLRRVPLRRQDGAGAPRRRDGRGPRFVINATNVQTGKLFRFSRPYEGDYSVGLWRNPSTRLADAVAASSAYPPTLSPYTSRPSGNFDESTAGPNRAEGFRKELWLTDGGVYDNLGLETAWKRYRTIFVSDAGAPLGVDLEPHRNWIQHAIWVSDIVDHQVRALRKRQLIDGFERTARNGSYWAIRSDVANYGLGNPFPIPPGERGACAGRPDPPGRARRSHPMRPHQLGVRDRRHGAPSLGVSGRTSADSAPGDVRRRGRDLNSREACTPNGFRDRPVRPLRHPSAGS